MFLTGFTMAMELRGLVPATILSFSMIPYGTVELAISLLLPRDLSRKLRNAIYKNYLRTTLFIFENVSGVKIYLYGDVDEILNNKDTALILSNHLSNVDWAAITMLATRHSQNGTEFGLRFLVKYAIHFVPLFGWGLFQGNIFVRRFGKFTAEPIIKQLRYLTSLNEPFWLHIFPEGTRFKPKFLIECQSYSRQNQLPVLNHTLVPRTKAFNLSLQELREKLDCVYDLTIAYANGNDKKHAPNMLKFCCGPEPYSLHIHVCRYPIDSIPTQINEQKTWLFKRFAEKDELLEEYYKNGAFPGQYSQNPITHPSLLRNLVPFLCFSGAAVLSIFSKRLQMVYLGTIAISPLLIVWLHLRKSI